MTLIAQYSHIDFAFVLTDRGKIIELTLITVKELKKVVELLLLLGS